MTFVGITGITGATERAAGTGFFTVATLGTNLNTCCVSTLMPFGGSLPFFVITVSSFVITASPERWVLLRRGRPLLRVPSVDVVEVIVTSFSSPVVIPLFKDIT